MIMHESTKQKPDKNSMAVCGAQIIDAVRDGGKTFFELCESIGFSADVIRCSLDTFLKNGMLANFLGRYMLEDGMGDFAVPVKNSTSNRAKYHAVAPAKFNLSLAVVGKGDKLHELDMLFCPFDLVWDEADFVPSDDNSISVENNTGHDDFDSERFVKEIKPKVEKLAKKFDVTGEVRLKKGVPLGAGLGGSTSSLVAVYYAFKKYADEKGLKYDISPKYLTSLSSDFPAMLLGCACRVCGVGEKVEEVFERIKIKFVGFKIADGGSDTAAVYKKYDENGKIGVAKPPETVLQALKNPRNDLFAPACALNKNIKRAFDELKAEKPDFLLMTGSGSGVVALDYQMISDENPTA